MTLEEYMDKYYQGWRRLNNRNADENEFLEEFGLTEDEIRSEYRELKERELEMLKKWRGNEHRQGNQRT